MSAPRGAIPMAAILGAVAATLAAFVATESLALALAPLGLGLLGWAIFRAAPHRVALVVFFLAVVVDNPKEHPAEGRWSSPFAPLGVLLYENLNTITGVQALRFSVTDVLLAVLFVAAILRAPRPGAVPTPPTIQRLLALAWAAVVWLELWGLARGGDFKASLWQIRPLFWAPVIAFVLAAGLRGPRDHLALGKAVALAAAIKGSLGAYYYVVICRPLGYTPAFATTHSDSVLFVAAAMMAIAYALEARTRRGLLASAAILTPALIGVVVNGRRLAYVSVAASLLAVYALLPQGIVRRTADRLVVAGAPLTLVYLAAGWTSDATIFGPARKVASLFSKADRSAATRDIENFNLVFSWKQHALLGTGFGHEYQELARPEGMDRIFPLYRYIAHNSVLWLENTGGYLGFTCFWMLPAALAWFAARAYLAARSPVDRAAALTALSVPVIFGVQAYGDMGLGSWTAVYFLGLGLAVAGKLAVAAGGFPAAGEVIMHALDTSSRSPGRQLTPQTAATTSAPPAAARIDAAGLTHLWLAAQRRRWRALALIPVGAGLSVLELAAGLAEVGQQHLGGPVAVRDATRVTLATLQHELFTLAELGERAEHTVIALPPLPGSPAGVAVAQAADLAVLCIALGESVIAEAEKIVEEVGRERILGAVILADRRARSVP